MLKPCNSSCCFIVEGQGEQCAFIKFPFLLFPEKNAQLTKFETFSLLFAGDRVKFGWVKKNPLKARKFVSFPLFPGLLVLLSSACNI